MNLPPTRLRPTRFTLLEMMVSMTILSIMMLMLAQYIIATQAAWAGTASLQRILDDQRVALGIMERDFNGAVASNLLDQRIPFYVANPATDNFFACFVTQSTDVGGATSQLVEVNYRVQGTSLKRLVIRQSDGAKWDFFNNTETTDPTWVNRDASDDDYEDILYDGVSSLNIRFYAHAQDVTPIPPGTVVFTMPQRIEVDLALYDPKAALTSRDGIARTERVISSIVYQNKLIEK